MSSSNTQGKGIMMSSNFGSISSVNPFEKKAQEIDSIDESDLERNVQNALAEFANTKGIDPQIVTESYEMLSNMLSSGLFSQMTQSHMSTASMLMEEGLIS